MKYLFLNKEFYDKYNKDEYPEIERKPSRPYILIKINIEGLDFGIPLRAGITHKYALFTDKPNNCGADYSKAVYIPDESYIVKGIIPTLRQNEHKYLKDKEYLLKKGFESYIEKYKSALNKLDKKRWKDLCDYSTLQYYHNELGIN